MGQGMERPVLEALVSDRLEERIEADFVRRMVNQAAPVICGVKPSSVFNYFPKACVGDADPDLVRRIAKDVIDTYSSLVSEYDVELVTVHASPERVALLAYRPSSLRKLLADDAVREFLQLQGYKTEDVASVVSCVCERMRRYYDAKRDRKRATCCERTGEPPLAAFPHEIGVLLGYPLPDVRGFIENGGQGAKERGPWKVYGDPEVARELFKEIERGTKRCRRCLKCGMSLGALLRLNVA